MNLSRRELLRALAATGAAVAIEPHQVLAQIAETAPCAGAAPVGELVRTLPLFRGQPQPQTFGVKYGGTGLDARQVTDLSLLEPEKLITSNDLAYIRTEIPAAAANHTGPWTLKVGGLLPEQQPIALEDLMRLSKNMGPHLFECSGNANPSNFGLMSVAEWEGIPLAEVVVRLKPSKDATGVLVSGFDHVGQQSRSVAGASWVYPLSTLEQLGAFFAVKMNGESLPADHGKPIRLVIPGWYGCTWIKWVNEVRMIGPAEPATSQMVEFAARTHQTQAHPLAADYAPAEIQTAATPVRVEQRRTSNGMEYRIVGIIWGGKKAVDRLAIRFQNDEPFVPFTICPQPKTHTMWSLWAYSWKPPKPGTYTIALKVPDASIPQRRLDNGHYVRQVTIAEV